MTAMTLAACMTPALGFPVFLDHPRSITTTNIVIKGSTTATGGLQMGSNGVAAHYINAGLSGGVSPAFGPNEWLSAGNVADWYVRVINTSGSVTNNGAALNTWLQLNVTRQFGQSVSGAGATSRSGVFTVELRFGASGGASVSFPGLTLVASITV